MGDFLARVRLVGASSAVLLCAACGGPPGVNGTSSASCVGPYVNDQPPDGPFSGPVPIVRPGATITLYGHWYTSTCNDTGGHDPLEPLPPVHLTLTLPGGEVSELGEFRPDGVDMGFSTEVHVPVATRAGTATVRDDRQPSGSYRFKIRQ